MRQKIKKFNPRCYYSSQKISGDRAIKLKYLFDYLKQMGFNIDMKMKKITLILATIFMFILLIVYTSAQYSVNSNNIPSLTAYQNNITSINYSSINQSFLPIVGGTMSGTIYSNLASGRDWLIGQIASTTWFRCGSSLFGVNSCTSANNQDLYFGSDDANQRMVFHDTTSAGAFNGAFDFAANKRISYYIGALFSETLRFEINETALSHYQYSDFKENSAVNIGLTDTTLLNVSLNASIPHYTKVTNYTIDQTYINNFGHDIFVYGSIQSDISAILDSAFITIEVDNITVQDIGVVQWGSTLTFTNSFTNGFGFAVRPKQTIKFVNQSSGSGLVSIVNQRFVQQ